MTLFVTTKMSGLNIKKCECAIRVHSNGTYGLLYSAWQHVCLLSLCGKEQLGLSV